MRQSAENKISRTKFLVICVIHLVPEAHSRNDACWLLVCKQPIHHGDTEVSQTAGDCRAVKPGGRVMIAQDGGRFDRSPGWPALKNIRVPRGRHISDRLTYAVPGALAPLSEHVTQDSAALRPGLSSHALRARYGCVPIRAGAPRIHTPTAQDPIIRPGLLRFHPSRYDGGLR